VPAAKSTTATSLSPASATYSVFPSGATASASGLVPTGAFGYGARSIVSFTVPAAVSTTEIESLSVFATYRSRVTGFTASALGCVPTVIEPCEAPVSAFTTETVLPPQLETYAFEPSLDSATAYGLCPTGTVVVDATPCPSGVSCRTESESPMSFATYSFCPSAEIARPAGKGARPDGVGGPGVNAIGADSASVPSAATS
jgi:hypothetical protein